MSIKDVGKQCLFSKMKGVITLNGEPATGAKLVRTANRAKPITDETTTDENGYFEFDAIFERSVTKFLPQEFVANQEIIVHYKGNEYDIWSAVKRSPEENTESKGKELNVRCELSDEKTMIMVNRSPISSRCTWDVEPDPKRDLF